MIKRKPKNMKFISSIIFNDLKYIFIVNNMVLSHNLRVELGGSSPD